MNSCAKVPFLFLPFSPSDCPLPLATCSKIYGGFDWALSRFLHSDKDADAALAPGPYFTGKTPTRVLALHPDVDLSRTRNLRDFKRITAGLLQVCATHHMHEWGT